MIYELDKKDYIKVEDLFTKLKNQTAIESIFNFKNEARLFVDNRENPKSLFILNSWAYYYLAGESKNEKFNSSLVEFLKMTFFLSVSEKIKIHLLLSILILSSGAVRLKSFSHINPYRNREKLILHMIKANLIKTGKIVFLKVSVLKRSVQKLFNPYPIMKNL